jgi:hypothetical protein
MQALACRQHRYQPLRLHVRRNGHGSPGQEVYTIELMAWARFAVSTFSQSAPGRLFPLAATENQGTIKPLARLRFGCASLMIIVLMMS